MTTREIIDVDTLRARQGALRHQGRLHAGHWLIVGLSVAITLFAWHVSRSALEERALRRFANESDRVVALMRERLKHYEDALLSGVAAIRANGGDTSRERWRVYAERLQLAERYPGVNGIGVIHHVPGGELDAYVSRQRRERGGSFSIHPEHGAGVHLPITYIEPERDNAEAIGLDVAFERHRRTAALRARRLGTTQVSGPIVLVQDAGRTPGFLFYAPYYAEGGAEETLAGEAASADRERRFRGLVYAPLVVRSLVAGVLGQESRQVSFSIRDGGEVLHDESGASGEAARSATFSRTESLSVYGREWTFDIHSTPGFDSASGASQPLVVLFSGLTLDTMLLVLFALMSRSNRRVLRLAERLTDDLSAQSSTLAEANRDLESFARVVSHDLKTPVRGIHDLTDFLEEDLGDYLASEAAHPDVARNLGRLREQARRGSALIAGILDYSVVGLEHERRARVDSREVVESIGESLRLRPGQLVVDGELPVLVTHEVRFGQVLANLIGNAFKYNPDRDGAMVRVSAARHGAFFHFSVADNGPGIEPRFHERVFEAFETLEKRTDVDSSGIGLSIVRKAVERLGGTVTLDSALGRGSTFRFTWPVSADDAGAPPDEDSGTSRAA